MIGIHGHGSQELRIVDRPGANDLRRRSQKFTQLEKEGDEAGFHKGERLLLRGSGLGSSWSATLGKHWSSTDAADLRIADLLLLETQELNPILHHLLENRPGLWLR